MVSRIIYSRIVAASIRKRIDLCKSLSESKIKCSHSGATTRVNTCAFSESRPPQWMTPISKSASTLIQMSVLALFGVYLIWSIIPLWLPCKLLIEMAGCGLRSRPDDIEFLYEALRDLIGLSLWSAGVKTLCFSSFVRCIDGLSSDFPVFDRLLKRGSSSSSRSVVRKRACIAS